MITDQVFKPMDVREFTAWGQPQVAFVKRVSAEGQVAWAIHAADGSVMGVAPSRDLAFAAIRQHELEPMSVH